jgi:hypothetical protein
MAVVLQNQEEEKEQENQQLGGGPLTLSQGAQPASGMAGGGGQPTSRQRKGSGRFTNLQKYIDANQGAGARTGRQIERVAEKTQMRAEPEKEQRLQDIRSQVDAERQRLGQAGQFAQTIQEGTTEELQNLANQQADQFTQLRTGQTALPQLQEQKQQTIGQIGQTAQQLGNIAEQSRTEGGRFNLLRQAFGSPRYSAGQRRLDQLLLQGTGSGALGQLQQNLGNIAQQEQQQLGQIQQEFDTSAQDIQTQAEAAQQQLQGAIGGFGADAGGALGSVYQALEQQREAQRAAQDAEFSRIRSNIESGNIGQEEMELLGIAPEQRLFNIDLTDYARQVQRGDTNVSQADVITEEQQRRLDALTRLGGLGPAEQAINLGEVRGTPGIVFDQSGLQQRLSEAQSRLDEALLQNYKETRERGHKVGMFGGKKKSYGYAEGTGQDILDVIENRKNIEDLRTWTKGSASKQSRQARQALVDNFRRTLENMGYFNRLV